MSDELGRRADEIVRLREELDAARDEIEQLRAELEELRHREQVGGTAREMDQMRVPPSTSRPLPRRVLSATLDNDDPVAVRHRRCRRS